MIIKICFLNINIEYDFLDFHACIAPSIWELVSTEMLVYYRWPAAWGFSQRQSTMENKFVKNIDDGKKEKGFNISSDYWLYILENVLTFFSIGFCHLWNGSPVVKTNTLIDEIYCARQTFSN